MLKSKSRLLSSSDENMSKKSFFLLYSCLFAVVAFAVFYHYMEYGITFVRNGDGYYQHYTALEYFGKWLRRIIYTLFSEHKLVIPNWDFSIGLGSDVITTFNYYVIGDPLTLLSVLVPVKYTPYLYTFLCLFRYYLIGLCFSLYCFERKYNNVIGVLISAFTYTFCSYALYAGTMHPYFINPMIYLPLILISVEKIFKNRNPIYLTFIVCVAEISNFYFFYVLVIATVVYVLLRLVEIYKTDIRAMIPPLFKVAVSSVIGVLLGAVIFLPVVLKLYADSRVGVNYDYPLFYALKYYLRFPAAMISHNYKGGWTLLGYSVIILFSVAALFTARKKHTFLKVFFLIGLGGFVSPIFAGFANGFSYPCNRWGFVFSFIISFVVAATWEELFSIVNKKRLIAVAVLPVVYTGLCFLTDQTVKERMIVSTLSVIVICAGLLVCGFVLKDRKKSKLIFTSAVSFLCIACIVTNAHFVFFDADKKYYSKEYINNYSAPDAQSVKAAAEADGQTEFYRFSGDALSNNNTVRTGMSNTQYYWSLSDESISDFHESININESYYQFYNGFDDITSLNTLAGVKYFYNFPKDKNTNVPYGFVPTETADVYRNENALPLGYTYDGYITRAEYDALETSLDKQQALLQGVVLEEGDTYSVKAEPEFVTKELDKELIIKTKNVVYKDNTFIVTKEDAKVYFKIEPQKNSELYISLKDISYKGTSLYNLFTDDTSVDPNNIYNMESFEKLSEDRQEKIRQNHLYWTEQTIIPFAVGTMNSDKKIISGKQIQYFTPTFTFYCNKTAFDANLGYSEDGCEYIVLRFPYIGTYSFSDISIYAQNMELYDNSVKELSEETLRNVSVTTDRVTGNISVSSDKLLCLSIPYSDGWTAYVDGEEAELMKANLMYMALELDEGDHEIELRYTVPTIKIGAIVTIFGLLLLFAYYMWYHVMRKKNRITFKEID